MKNKPFPGSFTRICLTTGVVAGLAAIVLNLTVVRQKIAGLRSNLAEQTLARQNAERDLASTRGTLSAVSGTLKATQTILRTTAEEKQEALASLAEQTRRATQANAGLARASEERDTAQAELARYHAAGMEPEQIVAAAQRIKQLTASLVAAEKTNTSLVAQLKRWPITEAGPIQLPSKLVAKVLASDPKWHFILLDAGESKGVVANAELLIRRHGELVGRARVSRVQDDRCIADLMPGWELTEVREGDVVIPAFPHS
jgi:hypothetical protein